MMSTKPTRRTALSGLMALAAGLFAPAAVKTAEGDSAFAKELRAYDAQWDTWEAEHFGAPGSPERQRRDAGLALLLPCWHEVEEAAVAVLEAHECTDECKRDWNFCVWVEDIDGIQFFAESFRVMLEGEAPPDVEAVVAADRDRLREAAERGEHHHCPVLRMMRAMTSAGAVLGTILAADPDPDSWLSMRARRQRWGLSFMLAAARDSAHCRTANEAAHDALGGDLLD